MRTSKPEGYPQYPDLGTTVAKFRRGEGALATWDKAIRRLYGEAVEKAIRRLQRSELNRAGRRMPLQHNEPIGEARAVWLRNKLLACPAAIRRARKPDEWQRLYEQAMKEKKAKP